MWESYKINYLKSIATRHPIIFCAIVTSLYPIIEFFVLNILDNPHNISAYTIISKSITISIFGYIIWKFKWFHLCGFTSIGKWKAWLFMLPVLMYIAIALKIYYNLPSILNWLDLLNNSTEYQNNNLLVLIPIIIIGTSMEEFCFRGIIFFTVLLSCGRSKYGAFISATISSLLFSLIHFYFLIGTDIIINVSYHVIIDFIYIFLNRFLVGIFLCSLALYSNSILTPIAFHLILNFLIFIINFILIDNVDSYSQLFHFLITVPIGAIGSFVLVKNNPYNRINSLNSNND